MILYLMLITFIQQLLRDMVRCRFSSAPPTSPSTQDKRWILALPVIAITAYVIYGLWTSGFPRCYFCLKWYHPHCKEADEKKNNTE